ncbi:multicopper oxidase domain-containing protein [Mycolicibacterium nivoides]
MATGMRAGSDHRTGLTCSRVLFAAAGPQSTAIGGPMRKLAVALVADNPAIWILHCHHTYHQASGMMTSLNYHT